MFRKLTLAVVASLGLFAAAPAAKADVFVGGYYGPRPQVRHFHHRHYRPVAPYNVYYRTCPTAPWAIYQGYPVYQDAYRASFGLRTRGFEVYVR